MKKLNKLSDNQQFNLIRANFDAYKRWGFALEDNETELQTKKCYCIEVKPDKVTEEPKDKLEIVNCE
jgi:hypothetical protein